MEADVVAVSDVNGGVYDYGGIRYAGCPISQRAMHDGESKHVITVENADQIQADIVVESANGQTISSGDEILDNRGIQVVPTMLAKGDVTVSYFEWLQEINRRQWSKERVNTELETAMLTA